MVALHNDNAAELLNFDRFMAALKNWFEDPLANWKARTKIKNIKQVKYLVAAYIQD